MSAERPPKDPRSQEPALRLKREPVQVYDTSQEASGKPAQPRPQSDGMRAMTDDILDHHQQPYPQARMVTPFPKPIMRALSWGLLAGLLLGILWAQLMLREVVQIASFEGLFSMTPFTFSVFWAMMGAALVGLLVGVAAILLYPRDQP